MLDLVRLNSTPNNLDDYVREILPGFRQLYGPEAADYYALNGARAIATTMAGPEVLAFARMSGTVVSALLLAKRERARTTLSFLHVLENYRDTVAVDVLVEFAIDSLGDHAELITEFVPFHPMDLDPVFARRGFQKSERQLMCGPTSGLIPVLPAGFEFNHPTASDLEALAAVLAETYRGHPDRHLLLEAQSELQAFDYLRRASIGQFGRHDITHTLAAWKDGQCAGFALGCQVLPSLGFVLHLAVHPAFQGLGLGTFLLQGLSAAFAREGLDYIALGVTCDNPAVNLYNRAGLSEKIPIPVYYRAARAPNFASPSSDR